MMLHLEYSRVKQIFAKSLILCVLFPFAINIFSNQANAVVPQEETKLPTIPPLPPDPKIERSSEGGGAGGGNSVGIPSGDSDKSGGDKSGVIDKPRDEEGTPGQSDIGVVQVNFEKFGVYMSISLILDDTGKIVGVGGVRTSPVVGSKFKNYQQTKVSVVQSSSGQQFFLNVDATSDWGVSAKEYSEYDIHYTVEITLSQGGKIATPKGKVTSTPSWRRRT